jgi:hypothetical protein
MRVVVIARTGDVAAMLRIGSAWAEASCMDPVIKGDVGDVK